MSGDSVLVTGGAGFIGSQIVRDLVEGGNRVVVLDNFHVGRKENLDGLSSVAVSRKDLRTVEPSELRSLLRRYEVRRVFHLAALHFIPYCERHPEETVATNIEGTRRVLEAIDDSGVEQLVFASTGDVYGLSSRSTREDFAQEPFNIYGYSKLCCEHLMRMCARRSGVPRLVIARLFNTYGPRETNPHLIPQIVAQLKKGNTVSLGNLKPRRDYIFVQDVSRALLTLSRLRRPLAAYNVSWGRGYSVRDVVRTISRILGRDIHLKIDPKRVRKLERPVLIGDSSKIRRHTGWQPRIGLTAGLSQLLASEGLL